MITNTPAVHTSTVRPLVSSWLLIVPGLIKCGFGASYITGGCVMPNEPQLSRLIVIAPDSMAGPVIQVETCESHLPTLATSQPHIRLALPHDAIARIGTITEHRGRAAKRRPTTGGESSAGSAPLTSREAR